MLNLIKKLSFKTKRFKIDIFKKHIQKIWAYKIMM